MRRAGTQLRAGSGWLALSIVPWFVVAAVGPRAGAFAARPRHSHFEQSNLVSGRGSGNKDNRQVVQATGHRLRAEPSRSRFHAESIGPSRPAICAICLSRASSLG
jgi:hypothetical protein